MGQLLGNPLTNQIVAQRRRRLHQKCPLIKFIMGSLFFRESLKVR